jgi:tetratricopeptide (TPR) repeat protein
MMASAGVQQSSMPRGAAELKAVGNEAFKAFRLDEAVEDYSAAMAAAPDDPVFRSNRSAALFEAGRYTECIADVEGLFQSHPDTALAPKLALRAARSALWLQDVDAAERWLEHASLNADSIRAQAEAVAAHVTAWRKGAASGVFSSSVLAAASAGSGADAPALLRGKVRSERGELYVCGHDPPVSMLAGALANRAELLLTFLKSCG